MATKYSNLTNNRLVDNYALASPVKNGGRVRVLQDSFEVAAADVNQNTDLIMLAAIPASASITRLELATDEFDSDGTPAVTIDIGLYDVDGETAKDADALVAADDHAQSDNTAMETLYTAALADAGKKVYELAGDDATNMAAEYLVGIAINTVPDTAAAATVSFRIEYVDA